jgi:hypothetical protein
MTEIQHEIGTLYKENFGQLVSLLLSRFPGLSIESAEDAVQDAFAEASARVAFLRTNPAGYIPSAKIGPSISPSGQKEVKRYLQPLKSLSTLKK